MPIKAYLNAGNNTLTFRIIPAVDAARQRAKEYPYPVPYLCTPTAQHPPPSSRMLFARLPGRVQHVQWRVRESVHAAGRCCEGRVPKGCSAGARCVKQLVWLGCGGLSSLCTAGWRTMCSWAACLRAQVRGADRALQLPAQARVRLWLGLVRCTACNNLPRRVVQEVTNGCWHTQPAWLLTRLAKVRDMALARINGRSGSRLCTVRLPVRLLKQPHILWFNPPSTRYNAALQ